MSDHLNNLQAGAPKNIEELRSEILQDLNEKFARLESYDFRMVPPIPEDNRLLHPQIDYYFKNGNLATIIYQFKELALGLLRRFETFVANCSDYETLATFHNGLNSTSFDFRRWETLREAKETAEKDGTKISLQHAEDLTADVAKLTSEGLDAQKLLLDLSGNDPSNSEVIKMLLASSEGFPGDASVDNLKRMYQEFRKFLEAIQTPMSPLKAIKIIADYIIAAKHISDVATDSLVKDVFSNIFNILANYFNAVEIGYYYSEEV